MQPTLLIGLDGATFTVLEPLMAEGHMPHLRALLGGGARAGLLSTAHPLTPPAWTTLMTGRTPGHHGIFDFLRAEIRPAGAYFTLNDHRDIACETIWTLISRLGGRVMSLNFPMMAPPPPVDGAIVPGLVSGRHLRRNVQPPGLLQELKSIPGFNVDELSWDFEHEKKAMQNIPDEELETWVRFHIVRERRWHSVYEHLASQDAYDLAAVLFDGVDKLQHGCWRFLDADCMPSEPSAFERTMRVLCLQYFRELDQILGRMARLAGPQTRIFFASDHGFGPHTKVLRVNKWLEQQGYLRWRSEVGAAAPGFAGRNHYVLLDWQRTTVFAPSAATNGLHILVSRQPGEPGIRPEDYSSFRDRLIEQLFELRDPDTGTRLVADVLKREEAFPGPCVERAPDLTLVMFDYGFISVLDAEPILATRPTVTGTHQPVGVFGAAGPGIERGAVLPTQSIVDIAPTLLYSLGLEVPEDFEGHVMLEAFSAEHRRNNPVRIGPPTAQIGGVAEEEPPTDVEEEKRILDRLRSLGYVE